MRKIDRDSIMSSMPANFISAFNSIAPQINVINEVLNNKMIPLVLGSEILFDSEEPILLETLNKWASETRLYEKSRIILQQLFLLGNSKCCIIETKEGFYDLIVSNFTYMSSMAKVNMDDKLAVLWTNLNKSDSASLLKIVISQGSVAVYPYANIDNIRAQDAELYEKDLKLKSQPMVMKLVKDVFPAYEFVNRQLANLYGQDNQSYWNGTPDYWGVRGLLFDIYETFEVMRAERVKNQTRIVASMDQEELKNLSINKQHHDIAEYIPDFIIQTNLSSYQTGGNNIEVITGDPKLDTYQASLNWLIEKFYAGCGWNYGSNENQNYENKTKSLYSSQLDIQTSEEKQKILREGLYKLIDCMLELTGINYKEGEVRKYNIKFGVQDIINEFKQEESINTRLTNGTMSRIEAIQLMDNIDKPRAKQKLEEIEQDLISKSALEMEMYNNGEIEDNDNNDNEPKKEKEREQKLDGKELM